MFEAAADNYVTAVPGKTALVASGPGEQHELGARIVADFLEAGGWEVVCLGGNLVKGEILSDLILCNPFLFALSITSVFSLEEAWQLIRAIRGEAETHKLRVMLGGFVFSCFPRPWHDFEMDGCATDAEGAVSVANAWWEQRNR